MNYLAVAKKRVKSVALKPFTVGASVGAAVAAAASDAFATASIDLGTSGIQAAIQTAQDNYELVFLAIISFIVVMWGLTRLKSVFFK